MRIVRRFVFTAAFLVAALLMIRGARQYSDFLFMFYPGILREVETFLSELTAKMDYLLWERIALVALIWAGVTLLLDIILQENLLRWVSGVTAVAAFLLCAFVGLSGLNRYAPSIAESMRLEVRSDSTVKELRQAAAYYRDGANRAAARVARDDDGLFDAAEFEELGEQLGSGMKNMIRTSYVFGGSTVAPKELGYLSRYDIPAFYSCFTGECCVNSNMEDSALPFLMGCQAAKRMSITRDADAEFLSVLSCIASDSADYNYSGYFMAYRFCMQALEELDSASADTVARGESDALQADLTAATYMPEESLGLQWVERLEKLDKKELDVPERPEPPDIASLLICWYDHLVNPTGEETQAI